MYSNEDRGINWKDIIIKVIFAILFVMLLVWLFPKVPNMTAFYSNVFRENIKYMQEAGESYFTNERLPSEVGDSVKITLQEMYDKNMILPFVDEDGNACNAYQSYVQVTKYENEYELKTNLICNKEEKHVVKTLGCYDYCDDCDEEKEEKKEKKVETKKDGLTLEYQFKKKSDGSTTSYSCPNDNYILSLSSKTCTLTEVDKVKANKKYSGDVTKISDALAKVTEKKVYTPKEKSDGSVVYDCPDGYKPSGSGKNMKCYKEVSYKANTVKTCPNSKYRLNANKTLCILDTSTTAYSKKVCLDKDFNLNYAQTQCTGYTYYDAYYRNTYSPCPANYNPDSNGTTCTYRTSRAASVDARYLSWKWVETKTSYTPLTPYVTATEKLVYEGTEQVASCSGCYTQTTKYIYNRYVKQGCVDGWTLSSDKKTCHYTHTVNRTLTSEPYCTTGDRVGNTCRVLVTKAPTTTYYCSNGVKPIGNSCPSQFTTKPSTEYECDYKDDRQVGDRCYYKEYVSNIKKTNPSTYYCPPGYYDEGKGSSLKCYTYEEKVSYSCADKKADLKGTKCYTYEEGTVTYSCPKDYKQEIPNSTNCYKKITTTVKATATKASSSGYIYKWSKSKTLDGWTRTGKTRKVSQGA